MAKVKQAAHATQNGQSNSLSQSQKPSKEQELRDKILVRSIFACALVLPQVLLLSLSTETEQGPSPLSLYRDSLRSLQRFPHFLSSKPFLLVCFLLALQNVSYSFVWVCSKTFMRLCKLPILKSMGTPVDCMFAVFCVNKALQFIAPAVWYVTVAPLPSISDLSLYQVGTAVQLMAIGQVLNIAIYQAIGKVGVYYGTRLGRQVPWVHGYPFNVITHPQYCGVVLTVLGTFMLVCTPAHLQAGLFGLVVVQIGLYVIMGLVEQYC